MPNRRFPPPWSVEDIGAAFVVKDATGQKLVYVYYEAEPGRVIESLSFTNASLEADEGESCNACAKRQPFNGSSMTCSTNMGGRLRTSA